MLEKTRMFGSNTGFDAGGIMGERAEARAHEQIGTLGWEMGMVCRKCEGQGIFDCNRCDGTGKCARCDGRGYFRCKDCKGKGTIKV